MTGTNKREQQAPGQVSPSWQETFTLPGYGEDELTFSGRLFSEGSFFDEEDGALTRLRLFIQDGNCLVYSVISGSGLGKDRRVYRLKAENDLCHIDNGRQELSLPLDLLFTAVFGLCGVAAGQEAELRAALEESLNAVA